MSDRGYIPPPPVLVDSRAWCRAYAPPGTPNVLPLPDVGASLAEACMPAPIAWTVLVLSSNPGSNLQVQLQVAGVEGGWNTFGGLVTLPVLGTQPIPGRSIRVLRAGGTVAPGELISVMLAPVTWPAWAVPDPRAWNPAPGFYR